MNVAVVGPGAVGGTVAAELCRAHAHEVTVCARTAFDRIEVDTPSGKLIATPRLLLDPAQAAPVDWVLVATKAYDHAATAVWLRSLYADGTRIAILQNGVEHIERFSRYVPVDSLVPVVVDCPAERALPGRIRLRRKATLRGPFRPCIVQASASARCVASSLAYTARSSRTRVRQDRAPRRSAQRRLSSAFAALQLASRNQHPHHDRSTSHDARGAQAVHPEVLADVRPLEAGAS